MSQSLLNDKQKFVLTKVQETYNPIAIIAGGALRDQYYNKPIKDTDIFVSSNENKNLCKWLEEIFPQRIGLKEGEDVYDYQTNDKVYINGDLKSILTFSLDKDQFQLIWVNDPKAAIEKNFNFTINQILFDGKEIIKFPRFVETEKKKQIFFVRGVTKLNDWEISGYDRKILALTKKYPEFTFHPLQLKTFNERKAKINEFPIEEIMKERPPRPGVRPLLNQGLQGGRVHEEAPNIIRPGDRIDGGPVLRGQFNGQVWVRAGYLYRYQENENAWIRAGEWAPVPPQFQQWINR